VNSLDTSILLFLNQFSRLSEGFDLFMCLVAKNDLLKGGVPIALLWWFWFQEKRSEQQVRGRIIITLVSSLAALFIARTLALTLPFRVRPLYDPGLNFLIPYGLDPSTRESWSAFPSDHAVLVFALATGILWLSRTVGLAMISYMLVIVCFPRLYLGLHYPTDILAGALIGVGTTWFFITQERINQSIVQTSTDWLHRKPGFFYACLFLLTLQIATMFDAIRQIGHLTFRAVRAFL
jgi:undecaprenyl-diphosphatase